MINLLPPHYKKELKSEENLTLIFILKTLFLLFLIIFALVLFSIKIGLSSSVETQKIILDSQSREFERVKSVEEQLNSINKELSNLDSFYKNQFDLTNFLERISGLLPKGVYLNSFSYQKEGQKINLSGFSPTVELLLDFKNNLESQKDFKDVYFPTAIWLQLENIDFNVSLKIIY
jgi:Tfp pilus assembly protein PilN